VPGPLTFPTLPIGLGLAALGRPSYLTIGHAIDVGNHPDRYALGQQAARMLDVAWDHGIRYFDAARSYGMAEEFLGNWLSANAINPDDVVVASKWGYTYTAAWRPNATVQEVKDHSADVLRRQTAETRINLGTHLDLYQIHSATRQSGVLGDEAVIDQLWDLRHHGVAVGFTTSGPAQGETIETALEIERDGELLFTAVQATWNLLEPSAGTALSAAADAGLAVIVKEAVANGRLTTHTELLPAESLGGYAPDAVAIAAALRRPWSTLVLSGAATRDHLRSNLTALAVPPETIDELPDLAEPPTEYWAARAALEWT
jgi:aryl-alcohol dehydrogenase-like predicted oxidoreductase